MNKTDKELHAISGSPVEMDSRICFGIHYFDSEVKAKAYAEVVSRRGDAYNGGYNHGRGCGRDESWDYTNKAGVKLFAVTFA